MQSFPDLRHDVGLPANTDAERTILGAVILDNAAFAEALERLQSDDFSLDSHQRIFQSMAELWDAGHAIDIVTLTHALEAKKERETVGGIAYLASLTEGLPRRPVISDYIRIVKDKSLARKAMAVASALIARAADGSETAMDVIGDSIAALEANSAQGNKSGGEVQELAPDEYVRFEREADSPRGQLLGLSLLTSMLDSATCGLMEGELCILAARPSQGKTEAGLQIALKNARRGFRVHIQSLEMQRGAIMRRLWRLIARVPVAAMRDPRCLRPDQRQAIRNAQEELADLPIYIDDTHEVTVQAFRSKAVLAAKRWKADLIVVDYAQLLLVPKARNAVEEAKKQAESLRHVARDYCRTIALAQIRRAPPNDLNLFPDIEMIMGSSAFEQAAQMILMLHRTRENKLYTGEDFCFLGKMRELQQVQPLGIRAEKWGEFVDRFDDSHAQSHWTERD